MQASSASALTAIAERVKMIFAGRGDGKQPRVNNARGPTSANDFRLSGRAPL
jgi:hypothetical protein